MKKQSQYSKSKKIHLTIFFSIVILEWLLIFFDVIRFDDDYGIMSFAVIYAAFIIYLISAFIMTVIYHVEKVKSLFISLVLAVCLLGTTYFIPLGKSHFFFDLDFRVSTILMLPGFAVASLVGKTAELLKPSNFRHMPADVCEQNLDKIVSHKHMRVYPFDVGVQATGHIVIYAGIKLEGQEQDQAKAKVFRFLPTGKLDHDFMLAKKCVANDTKSLLIAPDDSIYLAVGKEGDNYKKKGVSGQERWEAYDAQGKLLNKTASNLSLGKGFEDLAFGLDGKLYGLDSSNLYLLDYQNTKQATMVFGQKTLDKTELRNMIPGIHFFHVKESGEITVSFQVDTDYYFANVGRDGEIKELKQNFCSKDVVYKDSQGRLYALEVYNPGYVLKFKQFQDVNSCVSDESYNKKMEKIFFDWRIFHYIKTVWDNKDRLILTSRKPDLKAQTRFPFYVLLPNGDPDPGFVLEL
ncbi:MAG: hypothetical protein ABII18_14040 [bacterium]|nr:hypothetical protein [bacterium]MBU1918402.1 hypothetical protein [bacterium]